MMVLNIFLIKLFNLEFTLTDLIDLALVALLLFQVYRLVRGTLGYNIFFGMLLIYVAYLVVKFLKLDLLTDILGQFVSAGVIALLIVFQPEIRRFLLQLGKVGSGEKKQGLFDFFSSRDNRGIQHETDAMEIMNAVNYFAETKTGALMVFFTTFKLQDLPNPGVKINGVISAKLLESIFEKSSPLHDGAVIISRGRIVFAGSVLPVSENPEVPERAGTRHRAAIGITEHTDGLALIVSEETGHVSFAKDGHIRTNISKEEAKNIITTSLSE